ncbi:MAG TPA: S-layer homology domain-containing protein [Candidatus Acutalibacter pullistercoris]|uniref:S-layer homology domain-containing protein n=1 Tax=Candidatus Acutalibacter pullistercoris TaxID=2838418 RepID=A0A9D1YEE7_9FIRM|nr:S-layer homology domain-containing protein [Candidatus Acutalibacter pullistercoris]
MIPLSASAATIDNLDLIYVDGNPVKFGDTVETKEGEVWVNLANDLPTGYELWVDDVTSSTEEVKLDTDPEPLSLAQYCDKDGVMTLILYRNADNSNLKEVDDTFTITVKKVDKFSTTMLDPDGFEFDGVGVYSAKVDNENAKVYVELARKTLTTSIEEDQDSLGAKMHVTTLQNATIDGADYALVDADDEDTFVVDSEDGSKHTTFQVIATYVDALETFSITGTDGETYTGTPVDTNRDDVADTVVVTLPESAIWDSYDEPIEGPELEVTYEVKGHVNSTVEIGTGANPAENPNVKTGDKVEFTGLETGKSALNYVLVSRLPANKDTGATQFYNLTVKLEESSDTTVVGAIVNRTIAKVDNEAKEIEAYLPESDFDTIDEADVTLWVAPGAVPAIGTTQGTPGTPDASGVTEEGVAYDIYTFADVDLSKDKIVQITAEDDVTVEQYTLAAKHTENVTDAVINAFWLKDPATGATYEAEVTGKEDDLVITVPYMTTDISDWTVYITPAEYTYVTKSANSTSIADQIYSGGFKAAEIGFDDGFLPLEGDSTKLYAFNKNNPKVKEVYTIHVVLDKDSMTTGHALTDLEFTTQPTDNDNDEKVFRAIRDTKDTSRNLFNAEVEQETSGNHNVGTVNLPIPLSLTTSAGMREDLGFDYQNIATGYKTRDNEGTVFGIEEETFGYYILKPLQVLTDDDMNEGEEDIITASKLQNDGDAANVYSRIIVLPDETARKVLTGDASIVNEGPKPGKILVNKAEKDGTLYNVKIDPQPAQSGSELKSMSVGDTELTITDKRVITGNLNFSQTAAEDFDPEEPGGIDKATFVEFEISDYALLINEGTENDVVFFSNGDVTGDGTVDEINALNNYKGDGGEYYNYNNWKLVFERVDNADHDVNVYRVRGNNTNDRVKIDSLTVIAEDRLNSKLDGRGEATNDPAASTTTYTFDLHWNAPSEEAEITEFTLDGFEGTIKNTTSETRTITVNVPYGTDVKGMVAEFVASPGAVVTTGAPETGIPFESGITTMNYTNPVKVYVTSEDKDHTHMYVITVNQGYTFEDIDEDDWFYDDVVAAAEEGYINGMEPGKYEPLGKLTRAQFATMIARAMNYDSNPDVEASFPDVKDDHYAKAAINFCYENDIIRGYEDGTFKPEKTISRQEVAAILARAFNLEEISSKAYPDDSQIAGWASDDVYKCLAAELMMGDADTGNFRPVSDLTRAEAATILMNANRAGFID